LSWQNKRQAAHQVPPAFNPERLLALGLQDLFAAVKTIRRNVVTQMGLAGGRLDSQRRIGQKVVSAMHATLGWGLLVLLNSHFITPKKSIQFAFEPG
jgi:hypothetical protein